MTGGDTRAYDAKADSVVLWTIGSALIVALVVWAEFTPDFMRGSAHGRGAILNLLPPEGKMLFFGAIGLAMLAFFAWCVRLLFNLTLAIIDDDGITVFHFFRARRGLWRDLITIEEPNGKQKFVTLSFKPAGASSDKLVKLVVPGTFGVDLAAIAEDARRRVARFRARSVPATA